MARIDYAAIVNAEYKNMNGRVYKVISYEGKDEKKKHWYYVEFEESKNRYLAHYKQVAEGKCEDLQIVKLIKQKQNQVKLKERSRLSKKHEATYKKFNMQDVPMLALDQASNTGYCVILNNSVQKYGLIEKKYDDFYLNACYLVAEVTKLITRYKIKIVFIEDIFLGLNATVMEKLAGLKGMMISCAILNNCEYEVIHSLSWKTYHDLGYDRKEQKKKSIELARSIIRNADIDDNIADAILIGIFAAKKLRGD